MLELTVPALFAAGLAASPHCGLMCGALQVSMLHTRGSLPMARALILLHLGRVTGYTLLGLVAGGFGQWLLRDLPGPEWGRWIQLAAAALLVGLGLHQYRSQVRRRPAGCHAPDLPRRLRRLPPQPRLLLQGLAWAALPCGVLYAVLGLAAMSGSALFGGMLLAAFGLGSSPLLTGAGALIAHAGSMQNLRRGGALVLLAMGIATGAVAIVHPDAMTAWCGLY